MATINGVAASDFVVVPVETNDFTGWKKKLNGRAEGGEELEVLATGCTAGASGMPGSGGFSDKTTIAG